jgi:hypothetical protein
VSVISASRMQDLTNLHIAVNETQAIILFVTERGVQVTVKLKSEPVEILTFYGIPYSVRSATVQLGDEAESGYFCFSRSYAKQYDNGAFVVLFDDKRRVRHYGSIALHISWII